MGACSAHAAGPHVSSVRTWLRLVFAGSDLDIQPVSRRGCRAHRIRGERHRVVQRAVEIYAERTICGGCRDTDKAPRGGTDAVGGIPKGQHQ